MDTFDIGNMMYLVLLLMMVVGWFVASNRASLSKVFQQVLVWLFIFIGAIAVVGLWDDIRSTVRPMQSVDADAGQIVLPRGPDGHYHLTAEVNDVPVKFIVDTGASQIVLSIEDARAVGLNINELAFVSTAQTANGAVKTAPVRLKSLAVGSLKDSNVRAVVNEGELDKSLLGMSYLQRFSKVEIKNNQLILTR